MLLYRNYMWTDPKIIYITNITITKYLPLSFVHPVIYITLSSFIIQITNYLNFIDVYSYMWVKPRNINQRTCKVNNEEETRTMMSDCHLCFIYMYVGKVAWKYLMKSSLSTHQVRVNTEIVHQSDWLFKRFFWQL